VQKAVIRGERDVAIVDVPDPQPKDGWVVVKVHAAPMCTEYKGYIAGRPNDQLGHEAAGEVVAVARPGRLKLGDRVVVMPLFACGVCALCLVGDYIHCERSHDFRAVHGTDDGRATMAQYLLKPDWLLPVIPAGVSYERASLACCALGPSFGAFETMRVGAFDTVLIVGAGPVGLGGIVNARYRGARVLVAEPAPWRAARARELGAAAVVDPSAPGALPELLALTAGRGVDRALDCSGAPAGQRLCIDATRRKGAVAFVGESQEALSVRASPDFIRKGLALFGSWHYNLNDFGKVMQVIQTAPLLDRLISHVLPLREIRAAFELQEARVTAKVILQPWA